MIAVKQLAERFPIDSSTRSVERKAHIKFDNYLFYLSTDLNETNT